MKSRGSHSGAVLVLIAFFKLFSLFFMTMKALSTVGCFTLKHIQELHKINCKLEGVTDDEDENYDRECCCHIEVPFSSIIHHAVLATLPHFYKSQSIHHRQKYKRN